MFPSIGIIVENINSPYRAFKSIERFIHPLAELTGDFSECSIKFLNAINTGLRCGESNHHCIEELFLI